MLKSTECDRRSFLRQSLALTAGAALLPQLLSAKSELAGPGDGFRFLFQGDSITDGNRTRNNDWNHVMGHGYQYIISSKLWFDFPKKDFHFFNRGISGNKITNLEARWQTDTLDLKPDLLSILIGINDISAFINGNNDYTPAQFKNIYIALLQKTLAAFPNIQLVLCEPFILPVGKIKDNWTVYQDEVRKRQEIVKQLSAEYKTVFVGFQSAFNDALKRAPAEYWIWDGIHPMPAGHELMAREWLNQVLNKLRFIR